MDGVSTQTEQVEQEKVAPHGQKVKWSVVKKYDNYDDAKAHKDLLIGEGFTVKIHRMGIRGSLFGVKLASPLKKPKVQKEKPAKQKREPAKSDRKAKRARKKRDTQ